MGNPDLRDSAEIDAYFMEHFGKKTIQTDIALTEKYRYFPKFETGGTFGVNMRELNERILSFNYTSIYASDEERLRQHQDFILEHYLEQFNRETIQTKSFQHCGEPCPVVCKKMRDPYKKDYEPYHALGPQVGVFDQRAAEKLNDYVDAMGFDAIQWGGTLAWIMELISAGLIDPQEYGFPPATEMKFRFTCDRREFDLLADSARNAHYAIDVTTPCCSTRAPPFSARGCERRPANWTGSWAFTAWIGPFTWRMARMVTWRPTSTGCRGCLAPCR